MLNTNLTPPPYTSSSQQRSGGLLGDALAFTGEAFVKAGKKLGTEAAGAIQNAGKIVGDTFTQPIKTAEEIGMEAMAKLLPEEERPAFTENVLKIKNQASQALGNKKALAIKAKEQARQLELEAKNQAELKKVQGKIDALTLQKEALQPSKPENSVDPIFNVIQTKTELDAVLEQAEKMVKLFGP